MNKREDLGAVACVGAVDEGGSEVENTPERAETGVVLCSGGVHEGVSQELGVADLTTIDELGRLDDGLEDGPLRRRVGPGTKEALEGQRDVVVVGSSGLAVRDRDGFEESRSSNSDGWIAVDA